MDRVQTVDILSVPVGVYDMSSLLARLEELMAAPGCAVGYGVNAHAINLTYRYPAYWQALRHADVLYADGASLLLAARLLGNHLPEKLTTTDVWPELSAIAVRRGYRLFLLGGEPGLAERAALKARSQYPGIQIVGTHHGYFPMDDKAMVVRINAVRPDILWVGMGDPRQILWADTWRPELAAGLVLTCGGMFKIVAGELDRLPQKWRRRGFEWLYRLWQEPHTWERYLLGLPTFGLRILMSLIWKRGAPAYQRRPHGVELPDSRG